MLPIRQYKVFIIIQEHIGRFDVHVKRFSPVMDVGDCLRHLETPICFIHQRRMYLFVHASYDLIIQSTFSDVRR